MRPSQLHNSNSTAAQHQHQHKHYKCHQHCRSTSRCLCLCLTFSLSDFFFVCLYLCLSFSLSVLSLSVFFFVIARRGDVFSPEFCPLLPVRAVLRLLLNLLTDLPHLENIVFPFPLYRGTYRSFGGAQNTWATSHCISLPSMPTGVHTDHLVQRGQQCQQGYRLFGSEGSKTPLKLI